MLNKKVVLILVLGFLSCVLLSSGVFAGETGLIAGREFELADGWVEVNQENQEEMIEKYDIINKMGNYTSFFVKDSNYVKFIEEEAAENYDELYNYYTAYVFTNMMDISEYEISNEEFLDQFVEIVKSTYEENYENPEFVGIEEITIDNIPGYSFAFEVSPLVFKHLVFIEDKNIVTIIANYFPEQKASKEANDILGQLIDQ